MKPDSDEDVSVLDSQLDEQWLQFPLQTAQNVVEQSDAVQRFAYVQINVQNTQIHEDGQRVQNGLDKLAPVIVVTDHSSLYEHARIELEGRMVDESLIVSPHFGVVA